VGWGGGGWWCTRENSKNGPALVKKRKITRLLCGRAREESLGGGKRETNLRPRAKKRLSNNKKIEYLKNKRRGDTWGEKGRENQTSRAKTKGANQDRKRTQKKKRKASWTKAISFLGGQPTSTMGKRGGSNRGENTTKDSSDRRPASRKAENTQKGRRGGKRLGKKELAAMSGKKRERSSKTH